MKTLKKIAHAKSTIKKTLKKNVKKVTAVTEKELWFAAEKVKAIVKKESTIVKKESRGIATGIWNWWKSFSIEKRIFILLWILFLIVWLYLLRHMIAWILLFALGLFFVTGYFLKKESKLPKEY